LTDYVRKFSRIWIYCEVLE